MIKRPLLTCLLLSLLLNGCSLLPEVQDETKNWSASKFYAMASEALAEGNYTTANEYYEKLLARFPFGRYAMQSLLDSAYAHYKDSEPEAAIAQANRFIKLYPNNPHVDYAYYLIGLVNFTRNMTFFDRILPIDVTQRDSGAALQSFNDFEKLVRRFPNSEYSKDARLRMLYLRNNIAQHQIHVARYYMKRGAYLAAANRCIEVVEHFQRTPAMREALEIMIDAYDRLGLHDLSADTQRVLALNEQQGTLYTVDEASLEEKSYFQKLWDTLGLDEN